MEKGERRLKKFVAARGHLNGLYLFAGGWDKASSRSSGGYATGFVADSLGETRSCAGD